MLKALENLCKEEKGAVEVLMAIVTFALLVPNYLSFELKFMLSESPKQAFGYLLVADVTFIVIAALTSLFIKLFRLSKGDTEGLRYFIESLRETLAFIVISLNIALLISWYSFFMINRDIPLVTFVPACIINYITVLASLVLIITGLEGEKINKATAIAIVTAPLLVLLIPFLYPPLSPFVLMILLMIILVSVIFYLWREIG